MFRRRCIPTLPELPPAKEDEEEDEAQLSDYPWFEPPFKVDYAEYVMKYCGACEHVLILLHQAD